MERPRNNTEETSMDKPLNVDDVEVADLKSTSTDDAEWVGGYFAYGGDGARTRVSSTSRSRRESGLAATRTPERRRSSSSAAAGSSCWMTARSRSRMAT